MIFEQWEHFYREICSDMGIDPSADLESAGLLSAILGDRSTADHLEGFRGDSFYVIGNGPELAEALEFLGHGTTIVADSAIETFMEGGNIPDILVTDLDGNLDAIRYAYELGAVMVIHAHGDNMEQIRKYAQEFSERAVATTQGPPAGNLYNFFGFTDGDRAAYLADYLDAKEIILLGFDFAVPVPKENSDPERKMKKLKWAKVLLEELAMERGTTLETGPVIPL